MSKTLAELEEEHMALEDNMDTINDDIMRVEEEIQKLENRSISRKDTKDVG
jgi:prefoldin subunit 5